MCAMRGPLLSHMNMSKDEEEITEIQKNEVFMFGCILPKPSIALGLGNMALALTLLALLTSLLKSITLK